MGLMLVLFVLWEGFETIILPRRVTRKMALTRLFHRYTWLVWARLVYRCIPARHRDGVLSVYGPLSLLFLLSLWAGALVFGFGLLHWSSSPVSGPGVNAGGFWTNLYLSGTTFFTLGLGDVTPLTWLGKALTVLEAGLGFGFLALIISYLPVLGQSFSSRETTISMLDARAGSPPTALEIIRRHSGAQGREKLREFLYEWERWTAEFLENHLSYPVLAYFRSQHDNQSWVSAISAILDTSAFLMASNERRTCGQAELTFAIARHAVVDLSIVLHLAPMEPENDRLSSQDLIVLKQAFSEGNSKPSLGQEFDEALRRLRDLYEPYVHSLSSHFCLPVPPWVPEAGRKDNWQTSAWGRILGSTEKKHRHF